MKKVKIWLLATVALLFVVNSSIYGQWNGGVHDLSNTPNNTTYDYFAGTNPQGKLSFPALLITPASTVNVTADEEFSIALPGHYQVSPTGSGSAYGFFIYFLLCGVSTNR